MEMDGWRSHKPESESKSKPPPHLKVDREVANALVGGDEHVVALGRVHHDALDRHRPDVRPVLRDDGHVVPLHAHRELVVEAAVAEPQPRGAARADVGDVARRLGARAVYRDDAVYEPLLERLRRVGREHLLDVHRLRRLVVPLVEEQPVVDRVVVAPPRR